MNICMFTNTYLPHVGGVARSVHIFARDLRKLGHRVMIIAPEFDGDAPEEEDTLRLPAIQNFNGSDFSVRIPLPYMVEREIEAFEPDIIHSHHPFLLGDTAMRVARQNGIPLVFTHHTRYEQYVHYVPVDSDRLASFVINLATVYGNLCDGVIAPSRSIARLLASRGVTTPITEIPTGVDVDFFSQGDGGKFRQSQGIPEDALVVGHLGRLAPEKNLEFLTEAVTGVMERDAKAVFLIIGTGPSEAAIQEHFDNEHMTDQFFLAGKQTGDPLADAYAAMDIFVFASLSETQGMVLAEAMAAGVPVVALDASGVRDIVIDGYNGRLLPPAASPHEFSETVEAAVKDRRRMDKWGKAALQTAANQSRKVCAGRLAEFYNERLNADPYHHSGEKHDFGPLDALVERIRTEWDLLSAKFKSAADALPEDEVDIR